jgi:competence protein ComER
MEVGFIGTGSMGSILIDSFIVAKAIPPVKITIYNRTVEKAERITSHYPEIKIASSMEELIGRCETIFICVRPTDYKSVVDQLSQYAREEQTIISITSSVFIKDLENRVPSKIIKMIPSITNAVLSGAILIMYGNRIERSEREFWFRLFSAIGQPIEIDEKFVRISSDITSCGPAFISYLLGNFIDSAVKVSGISRESATFLVTEMIKGFSKLISTGSFTLESLRECVCVPGGITGVGLSVLEDELGPLFEHLFQKTQEKFEQDVEECKEWNSNPQK